MKRLPFLLMILAAFGACSDGSGPIPVAGLEILRQSGPVDEWTLQVGGTVQLSASLTDRDGEPLSGRAVDWRSDDPSVATVDSTGLVTGVSPGTATVTASSEGISDQVLIHVISANADLVCGEGEAGLTLQVGEVRQMSGQGSRVICVAGGSAGSEYVLVPFNAAEGSSTLQVEVAGSGVLPVIGPPNPARFSRAAAEGGWSATVPELRDDDDFHLRLRRRERELASLVRGGGLAPVFSRSVAASTPALGDTIRLNVNAESACTEPDRRLGRVEAVTERTVVVADTANPSGGFTREEYESFGLAFDTLVWPTITPNFGEPTDIDGNGGRVIVLFTRAVNELTEPNSDSYVGGFFYSRDLFPKTTTGNLSGCAGSNFAEMFYMLVPDPEGTVNNNRRSKEFVAQRTVGVLAHEFQHLISASRRLRIVNTSNFSEEVWLNEGLSHIAEELIFYATTPLGPRQNIDVETLRSSRTTFDRFVEHQWSNMARYIQYLKNPKEQSLMGVDARDDDLETRGATWAFLRYASDRKGGSESTLWRSMVDSDKLGLNNLENALGIPPLGWMRDWTVSVYADDAVPTASPFQQPSWNYRSIVTGLRNANTGQPLYSTFPLQVIHLGEGAVQRERLNLQGGGAAFIRFGIAPEGRAALRATSGDLPAPEPLMISILRTK